jgi:histidyl-tRNA synthetase
MNLLRAVKGMNDVLPDEMARVQRVERAFARTMDLYGFREVRTPLVEPTALFVRAIGEATDVVEKEMYSFVHHDEPLTLRPEGTAGAVRAYIEHGVPQAEPVTRWYYMGPMFRAERPQRGRYRQFWQAGAEIFGDRGPAADAEMIDLLVRFLREIGVPDARVLVNSLGDGAARERYKTALVDYLTPKADRLSPYSQRRLTENPLRILDSKDPKDADVLADAPSILEVLSAEDTAHFEAFRRHLDALGAPYEVAPRLVRGLDYYTRTLFEIKGATAKLGAGDTLVGGGRYDAMVADLGGPSVPAIGFAAGIERLVIASDSADVARSIDAFVAPLGEMAVEYGLVLARDLRAAGVATDLDGRKATLKAQLRRANAVGARFALIAGDDEVARGVVQLKDLAATSQETVNRADVVETLRRKLASARSAS